MEKRIDLYLVDVLNSINEIESYFVNRKLDFNEFLNNVRTKRATERNLEIIGEAVNRILKINPDVRLTTSRQIVDLRNRIIYNYDNISYEIIWGIVVKHLPLLKKEINELLNLNKQFIS